MSQEYVAFAPVVLPLFALIMVLLLRRWLGLRVLTWLSAMCLVLASGAAALPRLGLPGLSPVLPWLHAGFVGAQLQFDWNGASNLMLIAVAVLGAIGILAYGSGVGARIKVGSAALLGVLMTVTGTAIAVGATAPLVAVGGAGLSGLGALLSELTTVPSDAEATGGGIVGLMVGCALLALATLLDPVLSKTTSLWAAGCLVLMLEGPLRIGRGRMPPFVRTLSLVLGLPAVGSWLLVHSVTATPAIWPSQTLLLLTIGGVGLVLGGAVGAVIVRSLDGILAGGWTFQTGFILVSAGQHGPTLALMVHSVWTMLLLGWAAAAIKRSLGTAVIADLPPPAQPMRRTALVWGVTAASIVGLPLLGGYVLHAQLLAALQPPVAAVLLGASVLLLLGFLPPLMACVRRPVFRSTYEPAEQGVVASLVGMLALILGNGWDALRLLLLDPGHANLPLTILAGIGRIVLGLAIVAVVNRHLRQIRDQPVFIGGESAEEEPGWALPWIGMRGVVPQPRWQRMEPVRAAVAQYVLRLAPAGRLIVGRYYLGLVMALIIAAMLVIAGQGGR